MLNKEIKKDFIKLLIKENKENIDDSKIIDLFDKIMKGGFWLNSSKGSKEEVESYQKFLNHLKYDVEVTKKYDSKTKEKTIVLQKDIHADYSEDAGNYKDDNFKYDGAFGKQSLKMLIAALKSGNTKSTISSFQESFPNATASEPLIRWFVDHYDKIGTGSKKTEKKSKGTVKKSKNVGSIAGKAISSKIIDSTNYKVLPDPDKGEAMGRSYPKIRRPDFVKKFGPMALEVSKNTGIFPSTILAQAALESGWATKRLGDFGLFGVKGATRKNNKSIPHKPKGSWKGKVGLFKTKEKVGSKTIKVKRYFRIYDTIKDSFKDHIDVLLKSRYSKAIKSNDPYEQVMEIGAAGYAAMKTDKDTGEKINSYGPYLKKMLPGIIKEMEKQGISNEKQTKEKPMIGENKKMIQSFLKMLKEDAAVDDVISQEEADLDNKMSMFSTEFWDDDDNSAKTINNIDNQFNKKIYNKPDFIDTTAYKNIQELDHAEELYQFLLDVINKNLSFSKLENRRNEKVIYIQMGLSGIFSGFRNKLGNADSDFGNKTTACVNNFKKLIGIEENGTFDQKAAIAMLMSYLQGGKGMSAISFIRKNSNSGIKFDEPLKDSEEGENNNIAIEGEEFVVNGVRFKSAPYVEAANKAKELLASAENDPRTGKNAKRFDLTIDGKKWLIDNIFAGAPDKFQIGSHMTPKYIARMTDGKDTRAHWSSFWTNVCTYDDPEYQKERPYMGYINPQAYKNYIDTMKNPDANKGKTMWIAFKIGECPIDLGDQIFASAGDTFDAIKDRGVKKRHGRIFVSKEGDVIGGNESGRVGKGKVQLDKNGIPVKGQKYSGRTYKSVFKRVKVLGKDIGDVSESNGKKLANILENILYGRSL